MNDTKRIVAHIRPGRLHTVVDKNRRHGEGIVFEPFRPDGDAWDDIDIDFYRQWFGEPLI